MPAKFFHDRSQVAHFEITALLGSGGMGEVYQATETKLGRSVVIKVLPEAFTQTVWIDSREARVLASMIIPIVR